MRRIKRSKSKSLRKRKTDVKIEATSEQIDLFKIFKVNQFIVVLFDKKSNQITRQRTATARRHEHLYVSFQLL